MKNIEVVAAIIVKNHRILATRRGYGDFINQWEFPGGKIEPEESKEAALIREIQEELDAAILIDEYLCTIQYDYPNFHLTMHCYICTLEEDEITLLEHKEARWLNVDELDSVEWLPADIQLIDIIRKWFNKKS